MNLKKAKELIDRIRRNTEEIGDKINYVQLEEILEALAEPDEGEEFKDDKLDERFKAHSAQLRAWFEDQLQKQVYPYIKPTTPAFSFGDLVGDEDGHRAIFQRYAPDGETGCMVLTLDGDTICSSYWGTEDLKLIQRDLCSVSLGKIREKLRSKD